MRQLINVFSPIFPKTRLNRARLFQYSIFSEQRTTTGNGLTPMVVHIVFRADKLPRMGYPGTSRQAICFRGREYFLAMVEVRQAGKAHLFHLHTEHYDLNTPSMIPRTVK